MFFLDNGVAWIIDATLLLCVVFKSGNLILASLPYVPFQKGEFQKRMLLA